MSISSELKSLISTKKRFCSALNVPGDTSMRGIAHIISEGTDILPEDFTGSSPVFKQLALLEAVKNSIRTYLTIPENEPFSKYPGYVGGWNPLALFYKPVGGFWFDPSDLSSMFQDVEGTVPANADGDSVALLLDKSGNGNHAVQVVASSRPTLREIGSTRFLDFDGIDDFLFVKDSPSLRSKSATIQVSFNPGRTSARQDVFSGGSALAFPVNNWIVSLTGDKLNFLGRTPAGHLPVKNGIIIGEILNLSLTVVPGKLSVTEGSSPPKDISVTIGDDNTSGIWIGRSSSGSPAKIDLYSALFTPYTISRADELLAIDFYRGKHGE